MARRNFIVVDDVPEFGSQVDAAIKQYYHSKKIYDCNIIPFLNENHFEDAKQYIESNGENIDIIFSDQDLVGGQGLELFKMLNRETKSGLSSVSKHLCVFKVMHSNRYQTLQKNQKEYSLSYNYFVNSESKEDIFTFLDYYENNIQSMKENGNPGYNGFLYKNPFFKKKFESKEAFKIDGQIVMPKDVLFIFMDKSRTHSDYYHFFYRKDDQIIMSIESKKPPTDFNNLMDSLLFIQGSLLEDHNEKFKINPLWVSSIDKATSKIKLFPVNNLRYEIKFQKLESTQFFNSVDLDKLFL